MVGSIQNNLESCIAIIVAWWKQGNRLAKKVAKMKRKRLLEAVNDRVKKIAELACSLPSADDHVEAAEAIIRSEEARS